MPDTTDETQADQPPAQPRRTAATIAEEAKNLAADAMALAVVVGQEQQRQAELLTDLDQRTRGDVAQSDGVSWGDELAQVRRELNATREEMGGHVGKTSRDLDDHRTRLTKVESWAKAQDMAADAVSATLVEDAQSDLVAELVKRELSQVLARLEAAEDRAAKAAAMASRVAEPVDSQYVSELGDRVTALESVATVKPEAAVSRHEMELATAYMNETAERVGQLEDERIGMLSGPNAARVSPAKLGVHGKVLELMRDVDVLSKDREVSGGGQRYSYRGVDDAMDAVGRAMRDIGLIYSPEVLDKQVSHDEAENSSGRRLLWTSVYLTVRYTFTDPEDGSTHAFTMAGEGRASDDKATSKAHAMALKYGLLHALMVPVSDIPDADAEQPQVSRPTSVPTQSRPAEQPAAPTTATPGEQAARALAAIRQTSGLPLNEQRGQLLRIQERLNTVGISGHEVDGAKLSMHWLAAWRTLPPQDQGEADQASNGGF